MTVPIWTKLRRMVPQGPLIPKFWSYPKIPWPNYKPYWLFHSSAQGFDSYLPLCIFLPTKSFFFTISSAKTDKVHQSLVRTLIYCVYANGKCIMGDKPNRPHLVLLNHRTDLNKTWMDKSLRPGDRTILILSQSASSPNYFLWATFRSRFTWSRMHCYFLIVFLWRTVYETSNNIPHYTPPLCPSHINEGLNRSQNLEPSMDL